MTTAVMRFGPFLPILAIAGALACGTAPPAASASITVAGTIREETPAQHKLAHFRTADGMTGLTLDRTGAKPKYQVDGKPEIVELTQKEERAQSGSQLEGYFLVDPSGNRLFFLDAGGGITYEPDRDQLSLLFDKDAAPLGAATVTGTYAPPPPAWKATADRLTAVAVRTKFPEFTAEDSAKLGRVSDAVGKATADMFVHYAAHGQPDGLPRLVLVPQGFTGTSFGGVGYTSDAPWDRKGKGLARFGGRNEGWSHADTPRGNHMQVTTLMGYPPKLADGTPGVVWEVDGAKAVFVALDGGRYEVDLSRADHGQMLEAGAGPSSGWPAPAEDALLTVPDVSSLVRAGGEPQKDIDDLLAFDEKWTRCAAKVWGGVQRQIDSNHFTEADRKDTEKRARTVCAAYVQGQEALLVKIVTSRQAERQRLFATAKARVAQVGADR